MPARVPEELDQLFMKAMNAGDLEGVVALYEPGAIMMEPGELATGREAIREALTAFLAIKPKVTFEVKTLGQAGDIALTSAKWSLVGTGPAGNEMTMSSQSAEVARRQPDGTWLFVIDSFYGLQT